jgi:alkylhydroperoxidase family enzyme
VPEPFTVYAHHRRLLMANAVHETRRDWTYADALTTDPHTVTDDQVAELRRRFGDAGVMELTYQIGVKNMRARMNSALGIIEQGFSSGEACRIPWA